MRAGWCLLWLLWLPGAASLHAQATADPTYAFTAKDLEQGKKLFQAHCAPCHGMDGGGGSGANLRMSRLRRAESNTALFGLIQDGIPGTPMGPAWQLSDNELWHLLAYVRSFGRADGGAVPGDAQHGKTVYAQQGCAGCHIVSGQGGGFGPELTAIGAQRSAAYLRQAVVEPAAAVPAGFIPVRVVSREGREVRGIRTNEDAFTVQVKTLDNRFHSFRKSELAEYSALAGQSAMPAYKLPPSDLTDLVAYLAGLRGDQ